MAFRSLEEKAAIWDAKYNFPRPINEQYLNSYKAFMRYTGDLSRVFGYFCATLVFCRTFFIWLKISEVTSSSAPGLYVPLLIAGIIAVIVFFADYNSVSVAYTDISANFDGNCKMGNSQPFER